MLRTILTSVLLALVCVGGCTTGQPIITNARAARLEGVELYNRGDLEGAPGAFRNAVREEPRDYKSHFYQGLTYERLNNVQQALQSYKSALSVMQETPAGRGDADFRQIVMNMLASAIARYDTNHLEQDLLASQASNLQFDSKKRAETYFLLAKVARYSRDADSALQYYYKASELNRDDLWLQKEAGLYLLQMGQNHRSVKSIRRAHQLSARDPEIIAAMNQLKLDTSTGVLPGDGPKTVFRAKPLPNIDLKMGDTPVTVPDELPMD